MKNSENISWIFLAVDLASQNSPAGIKEISQVGDGINHAVPTSTELHESIKWLLNKNFILKVRSKYTLTEFGTKTISDSKNKSNQLFKIWENIQKCIEGILE